MGSRAYLEMYGAKMDVIALRQEAEQLESSHKDRHKLYERILTAQGDALTRNTEEINKLKAAAQQQEEAIAREEQKLLELEKTKQDLTEERRQLEQKKAELLEVRQKLDEMQDNNLMMRENLKKTSAIRETSHASRLALFANDPEKLAHENEIYAKYQTAYAGVCSIGDQPLSGITAGFNELQKTPGARPDAAGPDTLAVAAADPVNGDTGASAASVADPAKPAGQQVADASADQPKKAPVNVNSGMS
jgi:myosin heavy subunit